MENKEELEKELDKILTEVADSQNLKNYEVHANINADYGDGFVALFFTGEVKNKETGELINVAIKKAPDIDFDYNLVFKNENLFYSTIFPVLESLQEEANVSKPFDNVPKYFCAGMEPRKQFIAMEYLTPLGYGMFDKKEIFDKEHLEFIFKLYGKFHAFSYVLRNKNLEKYQEIIKQCSNIFPNLAEFAADKIAEAISEIVKNLNSTDKYKEICEAGQFLAEHAKKIFLKESKYNGDIKCITHGDCWSNNMLFKYLESRKLVDVKLIDFQLCRESTPVHDLSYFFYSGASKKDFDNLEYYLEIYYKEFSEFSQELRLDLKELFSFQVFLNEWKENALIGIMLGIWLWRMKLVSKEEFKKFMSEHEGLPKMEQFKLWDGFMAKIYESDLYKERTSSLLIHAYDYGILRKDKLVDNK